MSKLPHHVTWHQSKVNIQNRIALNKHQSCVIWLTGLSASGKSTIANELDVYLNSKNIRSYVLDGDNIRHGLNKDLGFSPEDRKENIRRIGEVAKLFVDAGLITIAAFISPNITDRKIVREMFAEGEFIEVYVKCSLDECEKRDPKGLYKLARSKQLNEFTGVSAPYEAPENPDLVLETDKQTTGFSLHQMVGFLKKGGYL